MRVVKTIVLTAIGLGIIKVFSYGKALENAGSSLSTVTTVKIHDLNLKKGLTLRIDVTLKNPSETTLTLKQPYVTVFFEKNEIGTSQIVNKVIELLPYSAKPLDAIFLTIPATGLLTLGNNLLKFLLQNKPATIITRVITSVKIAGFFKGYTNDTVTNFKPKA